MMAVRHNPEEEQILAKLTKGVDIKKERQKRARWAMAFAALAGAAVAAYRYRGRVQQVLQSDLTAQGLSSQNFSSTQINRILAVEPWVEEYAAENNLSPDFVNGVIWVESRFQPGVTSSAGARGLMQLMPATQNGWEEAGGIPAGDPFNPQHNIRVGTYGLRRLYGKLDGDTRMVLGAYNWGIGNVLKHPDSFPSKVEDYVNWVLNAQRRFERARAA
jgi:soluble lytic murein transglycosylase-like protein